VVFLFAVLFLASKYHLPRKITRVLPHAGVGDTGGRRATLGVIRDIDGSLRRFIGIKTLISVIIGAGTGVVTALFGVAFPIIWALVTFLLNFIPSLGSLISVVTVFLFAFAQFGDIGFALWILLALFGVQLITGAILEPALVGDTLDLSLLVVFVSLLFWGWLWGAAGVLLGVPMTAVVKLILKSIPGTARFVGLLESARPPRQPLLPGRYRRPPPA
jgi:predicted PurR-regulated permease PerM